jgi:DNA helicase-2/ATP-dependent DNA helicase PcrA
MTFKPSKYQQAVFNFITEGEGSAVIKAVAGSGKTTTIVQAQELIPATQDVLFLAFNKSIATELQAKVPKHVQACTFHSLGMRAVLRSLKGRPEVDSKKTWRILKADFVEFDVNVYGPVVAKLVGLAKAHGMAPGNVASHPIEHCSTQAWWDLVDHYAVESQQDEFDWDRAFQIAEHVLTVSIKECDVAIDFDDMLYLPVVQGLAMQRFPFVFVDEAQDVSAIQLAMLHKVLAPGGRLIAVGDDAQAIYGFRGAGSDAIDQIVSEFSAKVLPLSISYRCARKIVEEAQTVMPSIESFEGAAEGLVEAPEAWGQDLNPGDAILCRNTAPLLNVAFALVRSGKGCEVLGRDIGQGLVTLIKKLNAKGIDALRTKLDAWEKRETERAMNKGQEEQAQAIEDRAACIRVCIDNLPETGRTIPALVKRIQDLFTPPNNGNLVQLATVHRTKGLEYDRIFLLDRDKYMPSKFARRDWQKRQEQNLIYVAITRAKSELRYVSTDTFSTEAPAA